MLDALLDRGAGGQPLGAGDLVRSPHGGEVGGLGLGVVEVALDGGGLGVLGGLTPEGGLQLRGVHGREDGLGEKHLEGRGEDGGLDPQPAKPGPLAHT